MTEHTPMEAEFWQLVETRLAELTAYAAAWRPVMSDARLSFCPGRKNPVHVYLYFEGGEDAPSASGYSTCVMGAINKAWREVNRLKAMESGTPTPDEYDAWRKRVRQAYRDRPEDTSAQDREGMLADYHEKRADEKRCGFGEG